MTVKEVTEVTRHEPTSETPLGRGGLSNLPSCDITGLDKDSGDSDYSDSTWCGSACDTTKASLDLSYNNVTFYGSVYLAPNGADRSSFVSNDTATEVTNILFSTTWANTGILASSMKSSSGSILHPGDAADGYDGTPGTECYPNGLVSGDLTQTYYINDDYNIACDWYSAGFSIKAGSAWYVPDFPFCSISDI